LVVLPEVMVSFDDEADAVLVGTAIPMGMLLV
jgi:hypothetical protein